VKRAAPWATNHPSSHDLRLASFVSGCINQRILLMDMHTVMGDADFFSIRAAKNLVTGLNRYPLSGTHRSRFAIPRNLHAVHDDKNVVVNRFEAHGPIRT
jgi:hypothetical protein